MPEFTPTQQRILAVLADGLPHRPEELFVTIDSEARMNNLMVHLSHIRKKLRPNGEDIICEKYNWKICYRHVRLLASAYNGYR